MAGYGAGLVVGLGVGLLGLGALSAMERGAPEVGVAAAPATEGSSLTGAVAAESAPGAEVSSSRQPVAD